MSAEAHGHEAHSGGHEAGHGAEAHAAPHAAAAHEAPHGGGHEVHAKNGSHAAKPAATATHAAAPAGAKSPAGNAYERVRHGLTSTASNVVATSSKFGAWTKKVLRAEELDPVEEVGILKTPFYATGHVIDGTALNVARRAMEVVEPTVQGLRALWRSTIGTILSPLNSLMHPVQTIKNPIRVVTSQAMIAKNLIMAPIRAAHEVIDRSITRTVEQINTKVKKIPILGPILATPTNFIASIASKVSAAVKNTLDWATSPVDYMHNAVAPA